MDPSGGTVEAEWRHFTDVVEAVEAVSDNFQNNQQNGGDHGVNPPIVGNLELLDGHNAKVPHCLHCLHKMQSSSSRFRVGHRLVCDA